MRAGPAMGGRRRGMWARGVAARSGQCLQVTEAVPSSPTKASLYGAILFTLQQTRWLPVSKASLVFTFTVFMVSCKVSLPALTHTDPRLPGWECGPVALCGPVGQP